MHEEQIIQKERVASEAANQPEGSPPKARIQSQIEQVKGLFHPLSEGCTVLKCDWFEGRGEELALTGFAFMAKHTSSDEVKRIWNKANLVVDFEDGMRRFVYRRQDVLKEAEGHTEDYQSGFYDATEAAFEVVRYVMDFWNRYKAIEAQGYEPVGQ